MRTNRAFTVLLVLSSVLMLTALGVAADHDQARRESRARDVQRRLNGSARANRATSKPCEIAKR